MQFTYSGTGAASHVFAQIVDEARNLVLGNQVTPIPVHARRRDSHDHARARGRAASAPGGRYQLQLIGGTRSTGRRAAWARSLLRGPGRAAYDFSLKRLKARSIDSSASSRGYHPSTLTTFHSGVL